MQNNNLEYRVGYTSLSGRLYAGFVRKDSWNWEGQPHEITDQAVLAVGQKLAREGHTMQVLLPDGRVLHLTADITDPSVTEVSNAKP